MHGFSVLGVRSPRGPHRAAECREGDDRQDDGRHVEGEGHPLVQVLGRAWRGLRGDAQLLGGLVHPRSDREEQAERAAEIGKQALIDGPRLFGIEIMDGEAKIGNSWYEVH